MGGWVLRHGMMAQKPRVRFANFEVRVTLPSLAVLCDYFLRSAAVGAVRLARRAAMACLGLGVALIDGGPAFGVDQDYGVGLRARGFHAGGAHGHAGDGEAFGFGAVLE